MKIVYKIIKLKLFKINLYYKNINKKKLSKLNNIYCKAGLIKN